MLIQLNLDTLREEQNNFQKLIKFNGIIPDVCFFKEKIVSKEDIIKLINYEGIEAIKIVPLVLNTGEIQIFLQPIGSGGVGPVPGPGVG